MTKPKTRDAAPKAGARKSRSGATPKRHTWMRNFLSALAETSNVSAAADKAKITVSHIYKARRSDAAFAALWQEALCEGYDNLEMELLQRLRTGNEGTEASRKFEYGIAFRLLAAHKDSVARQKAIRGNHDAARVVAEINDKLEQMRQRSIALGEYVDVEE